MNRDDESAEARRKLEALFSSGQPAKPKAVIGDSDVGTPFGRSRPARAEVFASPRRSLGKQPSEYRMRLERLRIARTPDEIREACDAFLAHHQLPDDAEILLKVLQHPSEKVTREAMGQISALLMQGRMPANILLDERLRDLEARATEDATLSYIHGLQAQLASAKAK